MVRRERLHAALDRAIERPLTVVAAPAGWGKTVLLSEWAAERDGRALVVDDAQLLDAHELEEIRALVREERAPVVVASRCDPDLAMPRLRVEGRLGELRSDDLAFTEDELAALLDGLGVDLAADRRRQLLARTDGWAAGIRLAVVALQSSSDPERLLDEFSGDDRVVADYLTDEVLAALAPDVRDFLLRTSVVDRLDVDLATALTDRDDAATVLDALERQGVFVVALDRRRRRYRYHALFAELLRARLALEQRAAVPELHERAADWFAAHGAPELAVHHALAAGDRARTRAVLAEHWLDLVAGGHAARVADLPHGDARLAVAAAHARVAEGDATGAVERLVALDEAPGWAGRLAPLVRARAVHDVAAGRRAAAAALGAGAADLGQGDEVGRAVALQLLGATELAAGTVEAAADRLEQAAALAAVPGRERLRLECLGPLAAVDVLHGRLARAETHGGAALDLAHHHGWDAAPAAGWALAALAAVALLRGDAATADRRAEAAMPAACADRDGPLTVALRAVRAHVRAAESDEDGARTLLRLVRDGLPGDGEALRRWLDALGPAPWAPSAGDGPAEIAARALRRLAGGDPAEALRLAVSLDARAGTHPTVRLSGLLVEALARDDLHEPGTAAALEAALELARAEGLRRPFLDAPARMRDLLRDHAGLRDGGAPLVAELLAELPAARAPGAPQPRESLSERERAVLRLMPTILANSEIASELFVSVNTVKTHVRSIYRKLDVGSRRDAVARAREVGLL